MPRHSTMVANDLSVSTPTDIQLKNNSILDAIQKKKKNEAKAEALRKQNEMTNTTAWYLLGWSFMASLVFGVRKELLKIPSFLYPENPGNSTLLSKLGLNSGFSFLTLISPVILIMSWINSIGTLRSLYQKKDRIAMDYVNATLNVCATLTWTTLYVLGAASALTLIAPALPYIAITLFSAFALSGLAGCFYNLYKAWESRHDSKVCNAYLKNAAKSALSVITNTLAVVLSVFLGFNVKEASEKMQSNILEGVAAIGNVFQTVLPIFIAYTAATVASLTVSTAKMNEETWDAICNPKKIQYAIEQNPFLLLNPVYCLKMVIFVVFGPVQALFHWIGKALVSDKKTEVVVEKPVIEKDVARKSAVETDAADNQLRLEDFPLATIKQTNLYDLIKKINNKIKVYDDKYPLIACAPEKIQAKRFHLVHLENYVKHKILKQKTASSTLVYNSIDEIEENSKILSPNVYRSLVRESLFCCRKGAVEKLTIEARDCEPEQRSKRSP